MSLIYTTTYHDANGKVVAVAIEDNEGDAREKAAIRLVEYIRDDVFNARRGPFKPETRISEGSTSLTIVPRAKPIPAKAPEVVRLGPAGKEKACQ